MKQRMKCLTLAVALACATSAHAQEEDRDAMEREKVEVLHETTLNLVKLLVQQGVIKQEAADAMVAEATRTATEKIAAERVAEKARLGEVEAQNKGVVRVQYVPETVKREIRDQVRQEVVAQAKAERWGDVNAVPEWLDRLKWDGDFRLRYQGDMFSQNNAPEYYFQSIGQSIGNTLENRDRERIRLRLGLNANVAPGVDVGVRISTGNTSDPVSTNQTLGTTANKFSLVLDRAFIKLTPLDALSAVGGRIPNPFFGTDLVWDDDLNFEGAAVGFHPWKKEIREFKPFATVGVFPLQEIEQNASVKAKDKWFYGAQAGAEWAPNLHTRIRGGLAYYDYRNIGGVANPTLNDTSYNQTAPQSRQKGNSLFNIDNDGNPVTNLFALAADYRIANLTLVADFAQTDPVHVIGTLDWARNVGFDQAKILARTGQNIEPEINGYQAKLTIGYPKITYPNEWQAFVGYRYLQRDAVLDAFTDSDFHLGGTNNKGFIIGGQYGIYKSTWLSARWLSSDEISGLPLSVDVLQLDLNAAF